MIENKEKEYELDGKQLKTKLIKKDIDEFARNRAYDIAFEALRKLNCPSLRPSKIQINASISNSAT